MIDENFLSAQAAVLDRHNMTVENRWIDSSVVDGQAHVLVGGDGPPLVWLNGIGTPGAMWAPLMSRIASVTHYVVDLPAYGLTDSTPQFATDLRANAVQFLTEVFDGLGLDRPVVVANSLGSLWASWLAIDQPERVSALAHIGCPAIVLDSSAPLPMRMLSVRPLGRLMTRLQPPSESQVEQLSKMVNEHPLPADIAKLILATEQLPHFRETFLATLNALLSLGGGRPAMALTSDQLAAIETPTLLLFARNDPMGGPEVGQRMVELRVVDGGHAPWIHHADQIEPHLNGFLAGVGDGVPLRSADPRAS